MQDHPNTTDGASQKAKGCCPKQTLDDVLLGSKHNTTKAKACAVVIQNGREEPSTSPIQRIHLEGKQGIIRERPAQHRQRDNEQTGIETNCEFRLGIHHDEIAVRAPGGDTTPRTKARKRMQLLWHAKKGGDTTRRFCHANKWARASWCYDN